MADIAGAVISAVECVTQCLSPSVGHPFKLIREFKSNFDKLKTEIQKLREKSTGIQLDVDVAVRNGDRIQENVQAWLKKEKEIQEKFQKWLERASKIIGDDNAAGKFKKDEETAAAPPAGGEIREGEVIAAAATGENREDAEIAAAKKQCFQGLCPDLKMRYKHSKEAETLQKEVVKHLEDGKFDKISDPVIPKDLRLLNTDYRAIESRTSTLENVISSLSDTNINIVGIYGMGGIGKTTLAKEVANQPETSKLFDSVIFVEVTEKQDIMKIQKEIAEKFPGLTFSHEDTGSGRAAKLYQRLQNEKYILIILDNVWAKIKLEEIGIALGEGRKLLLTARSVDVLEKMNSQQNFPVELLDDEEAWQLFKKISRENIEGSEFELVAREVAEKCARLPIVIVTVARSLENKALYVWRNASQEMGSSVDIRDIYKSIELSFNYLENVALKKTILLIRYANITSIDELLLYGMSLGIFEGINKIEARRDRLLTLVQQLKDSCLLLESNATGEDFSMHDVVREVAISIASREGHVFTKVYGELEWPDVNTLKVCHSIVLKDVKMGELPQVLECQQLKLLSISGVSYSSQVLGPPSLVRKYYLELHDGFFVRMTQLKVLVLDRVDLRSLFPSLRYLTNLQALGLYGCLLDDIATIGDLKKLEILSLKNSIMQKLPVEVGRLARLKSLDLRGCHPFLIPPDVISSLSHLEELYMGNFSGWEEEGFNKDRKNVSLDELKNLSNLTCLEILITDAKTLPKDLFFEKLERYKIKIASNQSMEFVDWRGIRDSCRKFKLSLPNTSICLKDGHIMQLKGIEDLRLYGSQDMESVVYGLDRDGFPQLKYLWVSNNDKALCIVDSKRDVTPTVFPLLELLSIKELFNLEKICRQVTTESSFSQLRKMKVEGCSKLENIFSFSIAKRFQLLQSVDISNCTNMKEIFSIERGDESNSNIGEVIDSIKLSQLRSLTLMYLPQLKSLDYNSDGSNTLFSGKLVLPNLEVLHLVQNNVERIWHNSMSSGIQNLTKLILRNCYSLKFLFSSAMIESFDRLQGLYIHNCPSLEEIMVIDDKDGLRKEERKNNVLFSISNIKMIVEKCDKLKTLFPLNTYTKFLRLESLSIFDCDLLEAIWDLESLDFAVKHNSVVIAQLSKLYIFTLPELKQVWNKDSKKFVSFEKLEEVRIIGCEVLKTVFPASVSSSLLQLERLEIIDCKEIVFVVEEVPETNSRLVFPRLIHLELRHLPKLRAFFSGRYTTECSTYFFLEKVNLLLSSSTSFENLTTLYVRYCKGLTNIVTSSTAKSMGQLREMTIWGCNMITELVLADEGDEAKDNEIVFRELKELTLSDLQSLTSFCSANYILIFPSLEELIVIECPEMKSFSGGKLITPKLQKVKHHGDGQFQECWKGDLNTTIEQLYEEMCERLGQIMIKLIYEEKEEVIEEVKVVAINSGVQMIYSDNEELNKEHNDKEDVSSSDNVVL